AGQGGDVVVSPFTGAAGVAGGHLAGVLEGVDVLLALDDINHVAVGDGTAHFREVVQHPAGVVQLPDPTVVTVGSALPEVLRVEPDDLVQELAVLVDVVVRVDDAGFGAAVGRRFEQVVDR